MIYRLGFTEARVISMDRGALLHPAKLSSSTEESHSVVCV